METNRKIPEYLPHYTVDDWETWERGWELLNGIPFRKEPQPESRHMDVLENIRDLFRDELKSVNSDYRPKLMRNCFLKDDVVVAPGMLIDRKFITGANIYSVPALVMEVISPVNKKDITAIKRLLYETKKIPYCLVVDPNSLTPEVEIFCYRENRYVLDVAGFNLSYEFKIGKEIITINFQKIEGEL